jgi:hypothetical protein
LPSAGLQTGFPPSQSASVRHSAQTPVAVLQTSLPSQSFVTTHSTQAPVAWLQIGVLPLWQSASVAHAGWQLWSTGEQDWLAGQSALLPHSSQLPSTHTGAAALGQFAFVKQSTHPS